MAGEAPALLVAALASGLHIALCHELFDAGFLTRLVDDAVH